jgi:apolipoprotein N-acyltransferase
LERITGRPFSVITLIGLGTVIYWIIRLIRKNKSVEAILFGITANLVISPYVMTYHFILTSPALAWISKSSRFLSLVIYGFMLLFFFGIARILPLPPFILYPISILVALVLLEIITRREVQVHEIYS